LKLGLQHAIPESHAAVVERPKLQLSYRLDGCLRKRRRQAFHESPPAHTVRHPPSFYRILRSSLLLQATAVSKSYAGIRALHEVSFDLRARETHALVGENGAGKSTLIKIFTGAITPDSGQISIHDRAIENHTPARARNLGIAAIYQHPALFPDLTVSENLAVRVERDSAWTRVQWAERRRNASQLLEQIEARIDPDTSVRDLSMPQQQMVEIACALGAEARIFIMDEPTAALANREVETLFSAIGQLRARGAGIVYISHRLEELPRIADRVTVLRDGCVVETRAIGDVDQAALIRMMVGRDLTAVFPKRAVPIGETVLETRELGCRATGIHGVNLQVRAGEILGVAGLVGSGRTELARMLFGLTPADQGAVRIGEEVRIDSPADAIRVGIGYVPEDRARYGVIPPMSIAENTSLASLGTVSRVGLLDFARERSLAASFAERLGTKMSSVSALVSSLSGGNQQKVALSRWLATKPRILILDEPTQGIDVGAKSEVHRLMVDLAEQGMGILMISSELPEILGMSDRVAVMSHGTIAATLDRSAASPERILELALGAHVN
jgi:rhamnose transport system ATP-binding protein